MKNMNNIMAKIIKAVKEVVSPDVEPIVGNIEVRDQQGNIVSILSSLDEAYALAGENGYQVTVR